MSKESANMLAHARKARFTAQEENLTRRGYWLVRKSDQQRFYISENVSEWKLNQVCNRVLSDTDFDYWVDYCLGPDVFGNPAWINLDQTDRFI